MYTHSRQGFSHFEISSIECDHDFTSFFLFLAVSAFPPSGAPVPKWRTRGRPKKVYDWFKFFATIFLTSVSASSQLSSTSSVSSAIPSSSKARKGSRLAAPAGQVKREDSYEKCFQLERTLGWYYFGVPNGAYFTRVILAWQSSCSFELLSSIYSAIELHSSHCPETTTQLSTNIVKITKVLNLSVWG